MLTVTGLSAGYHRNEVLHGIGFSLSDGLTVLLGENGSGKTTLFRVLSGSLRPFSGTVLLDGEDLTRLSVKERAGRITLLTGTHQTLSGMTGLDLAEMAFYPAHGLFYRPGKRENEKISSLAREMGAEALLSRPLDAMSGGERQTVGLLAAVCQDTPVLLLDEPTAPLDYNRTHAFFRQAKALAEKKILLAAVHDPALALRYADRILLMKEGKLVRDLFLKQTAPTDAEEALKLLYPGIRVTLSDGVPAVY